MSRQVQVCIIGCGPIGLTGAALLSRFGVKSLLVERRGALNTHPRSRFVDTNTMEVFRELGIEQAVEDTGLGPEWTKYNRWFETLTSLEYARIPSPSFHSVPRDSSPCLPVMTVQDHVERELLQIVKDDPNIEVRFDTTASDIRQDESFAYLTLEAADTEKAEEIAAQYIIGADGANSSTRSAIGAALDADTRPVVSQDVVFDADLSRYVDTQKAALLYSTPAPMSGLIFQPLDGKRRWRCQVIVPGPDLVPEAVIKQRILAAIGTADDVPIHIQSMRLWRPTPGCADRLSLGRIFLAGDAAHISIPSGGMGNNTGFAGIRNLAWKIAFVIRGISSVDILATYEQEHKPLALDRIAVGTQIYDAMVPMMRNQLLGEDIADAKSATSIYGNYDGTILGFELSSELIAEELQPAPPVDHPIKDYVRLIRAGRRAPHIWLDAQRKQSVLDYFGTAYVLLIGDSVDCAEYREIVERLAERQFPVSITRIRSEQESSPYTSEMAVLVRPDGIIADHWRGGSLTGDALERRLSERLPLL